MGVDYTLATGEIDDRPEFFVLGDILIECSYVVAEGPNFLRDFVAKDKFGRLSNKPCAYGEVHKVLRLQASHPKFFLFGSLVLEKFLVFRSLEGYTARNSTRVTASNFHSADVFQGHDHFPGVKHTIGCTLPFQEELA